MTTIRVMLNDQDITIAQNPLLASGDLETDILHADFSAEWDGFGKTAVFYQDEKNVYHAVLDDNGECVIPWEVMQTEGVLYFGIFGVNDDCRKTSEVVKYRIKKGAWSEETAVTTEPTPDVYAQILSFVASHAENKNNPHHVTAEQVGARPDTWTPTAADVGARPNTWNPNFLNDKDQIWYRNGLQYSGTPTNPLYMAVWDIDDSADASQPNRVVRGVEAEQARALIGAAPSGYGNGEAIVYKSWSDNDDSAFEKFIDSRFANAAYSDKILRITNLATYPACKVSGNGGFADVGIMTDGQTITIVGYFIFSAGLVSIAVKQKMSGKWHPWEYVNPPMISGEEYRTTKRHNGKPVYAKYTGDVGGLTDGVTSSFSFYDNGIIDNIASCNGEVWRDGGGKHSFPFVFGDGAQQFANCCANAAGGVVVHCPQGGLSLFNHCSFTIEYTKHKDG